MDRFSSGNLTFPVRDSGPPGGEVVVLLHGFPQDGSSWDDLTPALTTVGYRVLAPDQRGYAPGALPKGRRAYRMAELVSDAVALLDAAGAERAHVVGHDWGGAVAWSLAAKAPERLLSVTSLSTPHPAAMARSMLTSTQGIRSFYMAVHQLPWLSEKLLDPTTPSGRKRLVGALVSSGQDPARAEHDADLLAVPGVLTGALNWYRGLPLSGKPAGPVSVPALYIWGKSDRFLGRTAAELTARYVTGPYDFEAIEGGHWIQGDVADLLVPHFAANAANTAG